MRHARIPILLALLAALAACGGHDSTTDEEGAAPRTDPAVNPADVPLPPEAEGPDFVEGEPDDPGTDPQIEPDTFTTPPAP